KEPPQEPDPPAPVPNGSDSDAPPPSIFAMVAADDEPHNVRLHIRGNHQNLGEEVPRRFLQVIAGEAQAPIQEGSGRLQLAGRIADPANPLTARVMANRIWKHHFGQGIVRTPDNFGKTGDAPTHPELLDYLASRFIESGWSVKAMHRLILLSETYRQSSTQSQAAAKTDPRNLLLSHAPVRRLEAEAIRDAILSVAGTLEPTLYGPGIAPHISKYQDGRGKPGAGPLDGAGRRSIYIQVRRNFLTPLFLAFDYPLPISAIGRRGVSTVPSQALILMNNEFVTSQAAEWARRSASEPDAAKRIANLYRAAFARLPEAWEQTEVAKFLAARQSSPEAWADLCHVLLNSAEFIYVR
ncbi:MAG: DUF1553 domain-containing protein, partial [Bryobacteraceae bacterium]